ncbi:MAG TPA: MFS transporter [Polyangiaceae bacterium]|nr:MFS transporter [Polyangiaceae bacterium]
MAPSRAHLRVYYFVFFSALGVYNPFFPTWLEARGITGMRMSTITVLNPILGIVGPLAFGVVADLFGLRGSLLRIAAAGALLPFVALSALALVGRQVTYGALLPLIAVFAFFRGPLVSMADVTALEDPASYGRTRLFGSAGFLASAVVAGFVLSPKDAAALPVAVGLGLSGAFLAARKLPAKAPPRTQSSEDAFSLLLKPDYLVFLLGALLWYASHVSYDLCFSLHARDLGASPSFIGILWAVGVLAEIWLMSAFHQLGSKRSPVELVALGLGAAAIRFSLVSVVRSLPVLLILQPLHALSFALVWTAALEHVRRRAPARVLATGQSLFSVATCLGSATGMLTWGPLYARSGGPAVFSGAAGVAALGSITVAGLAWHARRAGLADPGRVLPAE